MSKPSIARALLLLALVLPSVCSRTYADEGASVDTTRVGPTERSHLPSPAEPWPGSYGDRETPGLGMISGTVRDTLGTPVQYAAVVVEGIRRGGYTDAGGSYSIGKVPPGQYTLSVHADGFYPTSSSDVRVEARNTTAANFRLTPRPAPPRRTPLIRPGEAMILADPSVRALARDARRFAVDLYARLAEAPGNLFFSPWSIRLALGMAYAGARGRTELQMAAALRDSVGSSHFHIATSLLDSLARTMPTATAPEDLAMEHAEAAWVADDLRLKPGYADTLRVRYGAPAHLVDFGQGDRTRAAINGWAGEGTHGRVRDLIPPGTLDRLTRLLLCDAIYFRGSWQDSFPTSRTWNERFRSSERGTVPAPFMHSTHSYRYLENRDLQMLELPYKGGNIAMVIILPRIVSGITSLERRLNPESLAVWIAGMRETHVEVSLPKFRTEGSFRLAGPLRSMGMHDAFGTRADFSGIASERPLFISDVFHRAFVAVTERGTQAAAASAAEITMGIIAEPPVKFLADHPFLFLIRDRASGAILFMGRLADPG